VSHIAPLKRSGEAIDVANAIVDIAASMYMTGQVVAIDGGMTLR
jgi:NAD(P)-dependent dehydrogenase (short-subunit alcohol dehydrogenase family)